MTVTTIMSDTRYKDAEWLEEQYHEKELSQAEIADKCGVADSTVTYWMEKHGIEARDLSTSSDTRYKDADWLEEQYYEHELTTYEIGDKCEVDQKTVAYWMEKHGIERCGPSKCARRTGVGIVSNRGYRAWNDSISNKYVPVHRLLAVAEYGFDAVCDMDVHHQNGIRWDNRPDNIELMTPSEHMSHHNRERFGIDDARYRDGAWLKEQYHENGLSTVEIGDNCDVSESTVQYWMEKHDIERREPSHNLRSDTPTGQLTLDDTRELEGAQTVNQ